MKIGMVTAQYMELGGVENVVRELSKRLKKMGHKVVLITRERSQNAEKFENFYDEVRVIKNSEKFTDYLWNSRKQFAAMNDIDVFHFHNWSTILPLAFSRKIRKVLTLHGTSTQVFLDLKKWGRVMPMWLVEEFCINIPDALTSITKYHLRHFWSFKGVRIVRNGVDTSEFNMKKYSNTMSYKKKFGLDDKKTILTVGKHVEQKGTEYLIKALEYIDEKVNLLIPSSGPRTNFLKRIAKKIDDKTGSQTHFLGNVSFDELKQLYALCDIFVLPSLNEGLPLTLLEAMSFGKPIITTEVGGIPEITNSERGILTEPRNEKQIGEAVNKILSNKKFMESLEKNARSYVEKNLDWDKIAKEYFYIYQDIMR